MLSRCAGQHTRRRCLPNHWNAASAMPFNRICLALAQSGIMQASCVVSTQRVALAPVACRSRPVRRSMVAVRATAATEEKAEASTSAPAAATPTPSSSGKAPSLTRPHQPRERSSSFPDALGT